MPSEFAELLAALSRALRALGLRWFLFGAQAAIVHGAERLTNDVDVTVDAGDLSSKALVAALEGAGFHLRVRNLNDFVRRTRVIPLRHRGSGIDLDLVLAGPGPEQLFLERARRKRIEGVSVPVVSADDLVVMKILAGRPKDLADVVEVLAAQRSRFPTARARRTFRSLEAALDQSDLLPAFERALAEARRAAGPSALRRGRDPRPRSS